MKSIVYHKLKLKENKNLNKDSSKKKSKEEDQSTNAKNKEDQYLFFVKGERKEEGKKNQSMTNHLTVDETCHTK